MHVNAIMYEIPQHDEVHIEALVASAGFGGFFFDDQAAIKAGARRCGNLYAGSPVTPGYSQVREAAESVSIQLVLSDGYVAKGDCASVQYSGVGGREPRFHAGALARLIEQELGRAVAGMRLNSFREAAQSAEQVIEGSPGLGRATAYGLSQALLDAAAHVAGHHLMGRVIKAEWNLPGLLEPVPIYAQTGDERYSNVDKYGQWLLTEVLKKVPHRQWVFSIPKRLRIYFLYDRKLLAKLSQCGWRVIRAYFQSGISDSEAVAGASIAVQTYGDFLNFNPHLHAIVTDGCFLSDGSFQMVSAFSPPDLQAAFQHEVLKMLKKEGKITDAIIDNMLSWHHSGFQVYMGNRLWPDDEDGLENLARYIIRACFSQQRMRYIPRQKSATGVAQVIYTSKDGRSEKTFDALDWLAQLVVHIPDRYAQTVRYYGYYSNKSRGMRKKADSDDQLPTLTESDISSKAFRRNWARMIQKIYQVDPLLCPKCHGAMKIIAFIEEESVIRKILVHLGLWETRNHDPPDLQGGDYEDEYTIDYTFSQLPLVDIEVTQ